MSSANPDAPPAILLLESDREVSFVLPPFLRRSGEVFATSDPSEAEQFLRSRRFQVLVIGVRLVDGAGLDLIRLMRTVEPCAQVMVLCERDAAEIPAALIAEGIGDVLVKPFDVAVVSPRIERLLEAMRQQKVEFERRRELETRVRHTDRVALLGTLVATVAHELSNPLAVLVGNGELMADVLAGDEPITAGDRVFLRDAAIDSAKAASMMSEYLRRVLHYARQKQEQHTVASLRDPIETALLFVRSRVSEKSINLHVSDLGRCPVVLHHTVAITQAVVNALSNAIDAAPEHGNVWLDVEECGDDAVISIRDDGPGLTAEQEHNFFEPFFTTKSAGTGLGTVVMRQVIQEHEGRIELASQTAPTGLRVRLLLPIRRPGSRA